MELLIIIVVLVLLFGGGGFYGYRGGAFAGPGPGIIGTIVLVVLIILAVKLLGGAAP